MRYLVTLFGFVGLVVGVITWTNARQPHVYAVAIAAIQLGGILLAIGMATSDIVAAIRRGPDRRAEQLSQSRQGKGSGTGADEIRDDDAFEAGYSAYWGKVGAESNPFKPETAEQRAWNEGWTQAQLEDNGREAGGVT